MPIRILHTSDWHLGASLENAAREEEHRRLLEWMLATLRQGRFDVLIVAGDVFQYAQPSAEAQRLYYRFLARVGVETDVRQVVVVGGNHDSASRLDAPREVLDVLNVHVVGGIGGESSQWERCLCPVHDTEGRVSAVVVAVPFIHEFRLGVRTTFRSHAEIAEEFREAFSRLYRELADMAEARYPGVPLVATGHLTCLGAQPGDYGTEIHQVGTIGALPGAIFDPRFEYVALGHVHRMFPIEGTRARYSGSPLPMNVVEARSPRYVIEVEIDADKAPGERASVQKHEVPRFREIVELKGPIDDVISRLHKLHSDCPLPPFVYVELEVDQYLLDGAQRVTEALDAHAAAIRPRVVDVRQRVRGRDEDAEKDASASRGLRDLRPEEVFLRLCRSRLSGEPDEALLTAFRSVASMLDAQDAPEASCEVDGETA